MNLPLVIVFVLAGVGSVGVCLIVASFVLVARQGGWNRAMQKPIAAGRWPMARRLMLAGASLTLTFAVGMVILRLIPGGIPWRDQSTELQHNSGRSATSPHLDVSPVLNEIRTRPKEAKEKCCCSFSLSLSRSPGPRTTSIDRCRNISRGRRSPFW
jgi:hypothetical protein